VPFKIADHLTLTIQDIAFGGEGVGRVDDFVVFVPFVLVGEVVEVAITEVKKEFCPRETFARRSAVAGARRTGLPPLRPMRRLPVSAR